MDQTILYQNTGDKEGGILPKFELLEFSFDVQPQLVTNDFNAEQQLAQIASFIEENANENTVKKIKSPENTNLLASYTLHVYFNSQLATRNSQLATSRLAGSHLAG